MTTTLYRAEYTTYHPIHMTRWGATEPAARRAIRQRVANVYEDEGDEADERAQQAHDDCIVTSHVFTMSAAGICRTLNNLDD